MSLKKLLFTIGGALSALVFAVNVSAQAQIAYTSPYELKFSLPIETLTAPDSMAPRNDINLESETPANEWYSARIRRKFGAWGPEPRHYPAPFQDFASTSPTWMRERLLAVAQRFIGMPYQHHHVPDWNPPADWPWKEVAYGRNSRGVDCSDFTSWLYNYGLGIKLPTNILTQANAEDVPGPSGTGQGRLPVQVIQSDNYENLVSKLKTGDLLYIKKKSEDTVSHVIMWVGEVGRAPGKVPLVIDSTGSGHKDSNGNVIPVGIHLRPFTKDSWYFTSFSHAHRIIP